MPEAALEYLQNHRVMFLATANKSGNPHVTPMIFVAESGGIYFSAADDSETARNLNENPVAEMVVADETSDPSKATGVQIEGSASAVSGGDAGRIGELFQKRIPQLGDAAASATYWRLEPQDVVQLSNGGRHEETHQALGQTWGKDHVGL